MRDIDLAQGLLAKLCHDLSGVLGAVDNSIDFLKMDNDNTRGKALDLLHLSAAQSIARLQFYRKAYGLAKYVGEVNLQEVNSLCRAFLDQKIDFKLDETYFNDPHLFLCDNTGKIIMCLVEVAASCLIYGGAIKVEIEKVDGAKRVAVVASGNKIKNDQEKCDILIGKFGADVLSAMNIHYYYIFKLAEDIKSKIKIIASTNQIEFILV
jgi:histidine phosphotransferase ChpT